MVDFHVTNIVANADLGWKIDIGKLCEERNVVRNENFPGVVYKQMEHVKSALIFASGKVVFTGAKSKDSIDNAFTELKKKMEKFRLLWFMYLFAWYEYFLNIFTFLLRNSNTILFIKCNYQ